MVVAKLCACRREPKLGAVMQTFCRRGRRRGHRFGTFAVFLLCRSVVAVTTLDTNICGLFHNPSPANVWLLAESSEWVISIQGEYSADGEWPRFRTLDWTSTNGTYGFGCACLHVVAEPGSHRIVRILSAKSQPLSSCTTAPSLRAKVDKLRLKP